MAFSSSEINLDVEQLKRELTIHEGSRCVTYRDSIGQLKAGVGHVLTAKEEKQFPENTPVEQDKIDEWLDSDIRKAYKLAETMLGTETFTKLDEVRKRAVCNMAFSLENRLAGFIKFIEYLRNSDYRAAANKLASSKWYEQARLRGQEVVEQVRSGRNIGRIA